MVVARRQVLRVLTNKKAGHRFPTGPLNVVTVLIELGLRDRKRRKLFHSGGLNAEKPVEAGSYILCPIAIKESGKSIMTPDIWHPKGPNTGQQFLPEKHNPLTTSSKCHEMLPVRSWSKPFCGIAKPTSFLWMLLIPTSTARSPITDVASSTAEIQVR